MKWKSLRDTYRRLKQKVEAKRQEYPDRDIPEPCWSYYDPMRWFSAYLVFPQKPRKNVGPPRVNNSGGSSSSPSQFMRSVARKLTRIAPANSVTPANNVAQAISLVPQNLVHKQNDVSNGDKVGNQLTVKIDSNKNEGAKGVSLDSCELFGREVAIGCREVKEAYKRELLFRQIRDAIFRARFPEAPDDSL